MVKSTPRNPIRSLRKLKRFQTHLHHHTTRTRTRTQTQTHNPNPSPPNPLQHTPPPLPYTSSPSPSPPLTRFPSGSGPNPDPRTPNSSVFPSDSNYGMGQLPPLPPLPSQNLLRRSVSDPVPFGSFTPSSTHLRFFDAPRNFLSGSGSGSGSGRNVSSKRLRRRSKKKGENGNNELISKSTTTSKDEEKKRREGAVRAERLGSDWITIMINCPCGSHYQFMITDEIEKKCYIKLI